MSKPAADTKTPDAPPAYILSHTMKNFRCFKQSVTLDLSDGNGKPAMWNVLLGENGVGKTTTLQWIAINNNEKVVAGYGAMRRMGNHALYKPMSSSPRTTLFNDNAELINAEEWLLQANYAAKTAKDGNKENAQARLDQVIDLVCGILPDGGVSDIRFELDESTAVMTPRVEAHTPFGWVRLRDLSLGYQAALTWMVDLAARLLERYPDSPNPLAEPAIVLVDEIDLHLHPKWQRELITKLRTTFPRTQFIVTAHSPLIVQAAPDANIALLKRVGDHVEIENEFDHVQNWRVDQILTSDVFGLDGAYPEYVQQKMQERSRIATKTRLTAADRKRLDALDAEIESLPVGETSADRQALDALRRANAFFENTRK